MFIFAVNADQSVEDNKPFDDPDAVAIANVIVPDVVTGDDPIVTPDVDELKPTDVTVPTEKVRLADKSNVVPFMVNVLDVGTAPKLAAVIVSQNGASLFVPSPVCDKYFFVVVVLPGNDSGAPALFE